MIRTPLLAPSAEGLWPPSPAAILAGVVLVALGAYALLGGADYGGGIWDLLASGPRRERQRALIAHAIGPIWEANHVWLILAIVVLFTCFPPVFATVSIVLCIPLSLMLVGIVLRGSAFSFRSYDPTHSRVQKHWGRIFAGASVLTPLLLGIVIGAIASDRAGRAPAITAGASFASAFIGPWLAPFPVAVGLFALTLFAFLAAVYLTVAAEGDVEVQNDFRLRALWAAGAVFATAAGTLAIAFRDARHVSAVLVGTWWALALHIAIAAAAVTAIGALVRRRYRLARLAAAAQVVLIIAGWGVAQYPYLVPPALTIEETAAPAATLRIELIAVGCGAVFLLPALAYLYWIFRRNPEVTDEHTGPV